MKVQELRDLLTKAAPGPWLAAPNEDGVVIRTHSPAAVPHSAGPFFDPISAGTWERNIICKAPIPTAEAIAALRNHADLFVELWEAATECHAYWVTGLGGKLDRFAATKRLQDALEALQNREP